MRYSLIFMFVVALAYHSRAQEKERYHSIYASVGTLSAKQSGWLLLSYMFDVPEPSSRVPLITVGYQYKFSRNVRFGGEFLYDKFWLNETDISSNIKSIMMRGDYLWLDRKNWCLYSGASSGIYWYKTTVPNPGNNPTDYSTGVAFAAHIYLIGGEYQIKYWNVFANLRMGSSGAINTGIRYSFK